MQLEMVGPDISSKWDDQAVKLLTSADGIDHKQLLTIKSPLANKSTLTNHPDMRDKLLNSDVFVLFNPVSSLNSTSLENVKIYDVGLFYNLFVINYLCLGIWRQRYHEGAMERHSTVPPPDS